MIRVGIYGSENSHAEAFSRIFNTNGNEYSDMKVVYIGGEEKSATDNIVQKYDVQAVSDPSEMTGKIDAFMVTSRDGALHLGYAKEFVKAGLPTFIDKPFTRNLHEAEELISLAKSSGSKLTGGSGVKLVADVLKFEEYAGSDTDGRLIGGDVWAPLNRHNPYGDFWFYSSHLAEICIRIFGMPAAVFASEVNDSVTCIAYYDTYTVTLHFTDKAYNYGATVIKEKGVKTGSIDISNCYDLEAQEFAAICNGEKMPQTYEELVLPVRFISATLESLECGKKVLM